MTDSKKSLFNASMINKNLPVPIYYQLQQQIQEFINDGTLKEGSKLPTEEEFCEIYNISRMTVRQTYNALLKQELIYREKGKGTFVSSHKLTFELSRLHSFSEDMEKRNLVVENQVLENKIVIPSNEMIRALEISPDQKLLKVKRLRIVQNTPMALETSHVVIKNCPGIEDINFVNESLYDILINKYNLAIDSSKQSLEPELTTRETGTLLNLKIGSPLIQMTGITYLDNNSPIEHIIGLYRGDRYKFTLNLKR